MECRFPLPEKKAAFWNISCSIRTVSFQPEDMIEHIWDGSVNTFSNSIRVHISSLRKKLKTAIDLTLFRIKLARAIYWRNTDDKKRFHTSLQLKLTLLLSLLMIVSCVLMYFFISHSAVSGMDGLQNYMIKVDPQDGDSPITFNVDPKALFLSSSRKSRKPKKLFLLRSVIATTIIILLSSVCTYFLTKKALTPLQKLTSEVSQIQAQNLFHPAGSSPIQRMKLHS